MSYINFTLITIKVLQGKGDLFTYLLQQGSTRQVGVYIIVALSSSKVSCYLFKKLLQQQSCIVGGGLKTTCGVLD